MSEPVTGEALMLFCGEAFGAPAFIPDELYLCPTKEWFLGEFASAWFTVMNKLGLATYRPEAWDCDDFARFCQAWAGICNAQTENRPADAALAVGTFCYTTMSGGGHAICVAFVRKGDTFEPVFMEPQTGQEKVLTEKERASCMTIIL